MSRTVTRKGVIAGITAALLLSGLLVGVSFAGGGGITEPQTIELVTTGCATNDENPATECNVFLLRDDEGKRSGELVRFKIAVWDTDGNRVGSSILECFSARKTRQTCTNILSLKPGPFTDRGTIVSTGLALPPRAITGGSGAYLNVRGEISGEPQSDGFHLFVNLIP